MTYLFVTLMWNDRGQAPEPEDIFALCCQSHGQGETSGYGHYVRPADFSVLTKQTKDAIYHNIAVLEMAKPLTEVIGKVVHTFREYDVLVMWSRQAYELLRRAFRESGHRLRTTRVVLLEELLRAAVAPQNGRPLGFRKALGTFRVQTTKETYYQPKYRAGFLLELWDRVGQLAAQSPEWAQTELFVHPKTRVVHLPDCPHLELEHAEPCTMQALLEGAHLCKDCQKKKALYLWEAKQLHTVVFRPHAGVFGIQQNYPPAPRLFYRVDDPQRLYHDRACPCCKARYEEEERRKWEPLLRKEDAQALMLTACDRCSPLGIRYAQAKKEIDRFCCQRGMQLALCGDEINVTTEIGAWKLIWLGKGKIWLYHKNSRKSRPTEHEEIPGYHSQAIHKKTILEYLEYIIQHDLYRKNAPLPGTKAKTESASRAGATHRGRGHHRVQKEIKHSYLPKKKKVSKANTLEELQELARQKIAAQNAQA